VTLPFYDSSVKKKFDYGSMEFDSICGESKTYKAKLKSVTERFKTLRYYASDSDNAIVTDNIWIRYEDHNKNNMLMKPIYITVKHGTSYIPLGLLNLKIEEDDKPKNESELVKVLTNTVASLDEDSLDDEDQE
jgi:hypothetical protein